MKTSQRDAVVLRGGKYDGYSVTVDFVDDDIDVIAMGDGENRALYCFDRGQWRYDQTTRLDLIGEEYRVLEVPDFTFEASRSFGTPSQSSKVAAFLTEFRTIERAATTISVRTIREMQAAGKSVPEIMRKVEAIQMVAQEMTDAELVKAINRLELEFKLGNRQSMLANQREYERKKQQFRKATAVPLR